jgi:hypothetical protein
MKVGRNFTLLHMSIFMLYIVPHIFLYQAGLYYGKLAVEVKYDAVFFQNCVLALIFMAVFAGAVKTAGIKRNVIRNNIISLSRKRWFLQLVILLTAFSYSLLALGIGVKNSDVSANAIILLIPREFLVVAATMIAFETRRKTWIALVMLHFLYWVLVGSKSSLLFPAIALVYYYVLTGRRVTKREVIGGAFGIIILVASYFLPLTIRLYQAYGSEFASLYAETLAQNSVSMLFRRISWFDGMFVTPEQFNRLESITSLDLVYGALSRLLPGLQSSAPPTGQIVVPLYHANNSENFAGGIGMPGTMSMMIANQGLMGLLGCLIIIFLTLLMIFSMIRSRDALLSIVGISALVLCFKSLFIGGNIDIALGKVLVLLISASVWFLCARSIAKALAVQTCRSERLRSKTAAPPLS